MVVPAIGVVDIDVNECFAVDLHFDRATGRRTPLGDLVNLAKTYDGKPGRLEAAQRLGRCLGWWAEQLATWRPAFAAVDVVCGVPANPPKEPFNLPDVLAAAVAASLGRPHAGGLLKKTRPTNQVKYTTDRGRKRDE